MDERALWKDEVAHLFIQRASWALPNSSSRTLELTLKPAHFRPFTPYALARTASGRTVCHPERSEGSGRTVHILDEWAVGRTNGQTFTSPPPYRLVLNRCSFLNHGCAATCSCYRLTPDPLSTTFPTGKIAERGADLAQPNPSSLTLDLTLTSRS